MKRRLITIVAADLVGYSRLMAADEEGTISRLRTSRSEVVDPAVDRAGGRIIKTMGDGLLIEFSSPVDAVRSMIAIQDQMAAHEIGPEDQRLRFRVGINLGDIVVDGEDVLGDGVNIAARLESLALSGGICVSRSVHDQLRGKIDLPMTDLGPQMVKNIPEPIEVWRIEVVGAVLAKTAKAEPASIAVLPFDNMSSDPEQEFLADGIVEDVITELSRFRSLLVIARNSTFAYKGTATDIRQIAKELGVRYVVEGSVRRGGDRIRLTAQLIDAETGAHLWADKWDRVIDDIFALQDELTEAIVTAVEPELGAHERKLARARPSQSLSAWELYQRGVTEHAKFTDEGLAEATTLFQRAIEMDPEFAPARALLARTIWTVVGSGRSANPASEIGMGIANARQAIGMDDREELAHAALGVLLAMAGEEIEAMSCVETAQALNPNSAFCRHAIAMVCLYQKSPDGVRMETNARAAVRLSPREPTAFMYHFLIGVGKWIKNDFEYSADQLQSYRNACAHQNADWFVFLIAATSYASIGETRLAQLCLDKALARNPSTTVETYRTAFPFPAWPEWFKKMQIDVDTLVELGLPRE